MFKCLNPLAIKAFRYFWNFSEKNRVSLSLVKIQKLAETHFCQAF